MKFRKLMVSLLLVCATALPMASANAFWGGGWMPWDWFDDDDYYYGPYGYPGYYGGYPGYYGGYPGYYGGYPGYYGGYPAYGGYPGYYGGYPGYGGWGPFSGW